MNQDHNSHYKSNASENVLSNNADCIQTTSAKNSTNHTFKRRKMNTARLAYGVWDYLSEVFVDHIVKTAYPIWRHLFHKHWNRDSQNACPESLLDWWIESRMLFLHSEAVHKSCTTIQSNANKIWDCNMWLDCFVLAAVLLCGEFWACKTALLVKSQSDSFKWKNNHAQNSRIVPGSETQDTEFHACTYSKVWKGVFDLGCVVVVSVYRIFGSHCALGDYSLCLRQAVWYSDRFQMHYTQDPAYNFISDVLKMWNLTKTFLRVTSDSAAVVCSTVKKFYTCWHGNRATEMKLKLFHVQCVAPVSTLLRKRACRKCIQGFEILGPLFRLSGHLWSTWIYFKISSLK